MPASIAYHTGCGRGRLVLQRANSHRVPSRSCRPDPLSASARRARAGTPRPTWASRFVGAVVTPTNHHRAHPVSASTMTTALAVIGTHDGVQQPPRTASSIAWPDPNGAVERGLPADEISAQ